MKTSTAVLSHPTTLLRRPEIPSDEYLGTMLETQSVKYANEHLGYKHPTKLRTRGASELTSALRASGIKPFDPQTVRDYKARCLLDKQGGGTNTLTGTVAKFVSDNRYDWRGFDTLVLVISTIVAVIGLGTTIAGAITGFSLVWPISLLVSGSALFPFAYLVRTQSRQWEWKQTRLNEYEGEVPKFALDTAEEIHMRAPGTRFYIEQLVNTDTQRVVDPFLIAYDPADQTLHYVEVWEEPNFDQTKRV
jgi:hypothetical protein